MTDEEILFTLLYGGSPSRAQTTILIDKDEMYSFNGRPVKPGAYWVTDGTNLEITQHELEAQNAFLSDKKVSSALGWYYLGKAKKDDRKIMCMKHQQMHTQAEGCPWCEKKCTKQGC